jgi:ATP-dependent Lon protease
MTGELTLKGEVLPSAGSTRRPSRRCARASRVIIPKGCAPVIKDLPREVRQGLKIHTAENIRDVLRLALERPLPRAPRRTLKAETERERKGFFEYIESNVAH